MAVPSARIDAAFWEGKRVFLTGHTGFKGSWLSLWLQSMNAKVQGLALVPPTTPSLFVEADVAPGMQGTTGDIRDYATVQACIRAFRPDMVIHLAAQPLVRLSYSQPVETYATNVMGTVNVLEAARHVDSVRVIVNVTTDKCYENKEWAWGYRESDAIGGDDPYSNSKSCSELVTLAYRRSFFQSGAISLASARAGNVIGGGDWAADRLVPDVLRSFEQGKPVRIRNPLSVRPWQHVLEPLSGYLALAQRLWHEPEDATGAWNFGPREEDARPVQWIVQRLAERWGGGARWVVDDDRHPHEAGQLKLDISKARAGLAWTPRWKLDTALEKVTAWHRAWLADEDVRALCLSQIAEHMNEPVEDCG